MENKIENICYVSEIYGKQPRAERHTHTRSMRLCVLERNERENIGAQLQSKAKHVLFYYLTPGHKFRVEIYLHIYTRARLSLALQISD